MKSPNSYEFSEGYVAHNIINALSFSDIADLSALFQEGLIRYIKRDPRITARCLFYSALDDYASVSGHSLRYFLFGSEEIPTSFYSSVDVAVIRVLNNLSDVQLDSLESIILRHYHSRLMDISPKLSPNKKYFSVLKIKLNSKLPDVLPEADLPKYRRDVLTEIQRYKSVNYSKDFFFHSDFWVDLATIAGVSVRWILGVKKTFLYCNKPQADNVFDLFTLMTPMQRFAFICLLHKISPIPIPELEALIYENGGLL